MSAMRATKGRPRRKDPGVSAIRVTTPAHQKGNDAAKFRKREKAMIRGRGNLKTTTQAEGDIQPLRRVLLTRPITHAQDIGLRGGCEEQASQLFECWKGLSRGYDVSTIASATDLKPAFVAAMADLFEP